jgi:hypothetical protein
MLLVNIQVVTAVQAVVVVLAVGLILLVAQQHQVKVTLGVHQHHQAMLLVVAAALVLLANKEAQFLLPLEMVVRVRHQALQVQALHMQGVGVGVEPLLLPLVLEALVVEVRAVLIR